MDKASIGGVLLAIAGIVAGLLMEGGNLGQILQPTAALIVFGGTMGAVLLQFPLTTVAAAFRSFTHVFAAPRKHNDELIRLLVAFANKARRNGVVSLDADLQTIQDPFLKQTVMLAVDGTEPGGPAQDHAGQPRFNHRKRRAAARGLRIGGRVLAHHRHSRRGAGTHPGDAAPRQHPGGRPRNRGRLRRHHLRSGHRQPLLPSHGGKDAPPHPRRLSAPGDDARRRDLHPRRNESRACWKSSSPDSSTRQSARKQERAA